MSEKPLSPEAVYSARPTVRVDQQEYPKVSELILAMEMRESEGGMSALELRVSNFASDTAGGGDFAFEDDRILKLGAEIAVYGGEQNTPVEIFRGKITGLESDFPENGPPEIVVLAEDAFQRSRMTRRTKVWDNVSIFDVASEVASQASLKPKITGLTEKLGVQVQLNESDLAFLRRLLARYDADMQVVATEMHVSPHKDVLRGTIDLELGSQLRKARALADLSHQVTEVTTAGWDPVQGKPVSGKSSGANPGPGSGVTGSSALQTALGSRSEHTGALAVSTSGEAKALADAIFDRRARRFVTLTATAEGNPAVRVGTQVNITGLGKRFNNSYYVVRACHRFDLAHGYETDFDAECAFMGKQ